MRPGHNFQLKGEWRNQPTGRIGSLWIFLSKLLDISAAQIYSPSTGISKTSKETPAFGAIRGQQILRKNGQVNTHGHLFSEWSEMTNKTGNRNIVKELVTNPIFSQAWSREPRERCWFFTRSFSSRMVRTSKSPSNKIINCKFQLENQVRRCCAIVPRKKTWR